MSEVSFVSFQGPTNKGLLTVEFTLHGQTETQGCILGPCPRKGKEGWLEGQLDVVVQAEVKARTSYYRNDWTGKLESDSAPGRAAVVESYRILLDPSGGIHVLAATEKSPALDPRTTQEYWDRKYEEGKAAANKSAADRLEGIAYSISPIVTSTTSVTGKVWTDTVHPTCQWESGKLIYREAKPGRPDENRYVECFAHIHEFDQKIVWASGHSRPCKYFAEALAEAKAAHESGSGVRLEPAVAPSRFGRGL